MSIADEIATHERITALRNLWRRASRNTDEARRALDAADRYRKAAEAAEWEAWEAYESAARALRNPHS